MMRRRSGFEVMMRLIGLVKPLTGFMILAIVMGTIGHLFATFITITGVDALWTASRDGAATVLRPFVIIMILLALFRGALRYAEQMCNHYIAFKLLALIRDRVFQSLRRLCPAKLEGKDKGDLISVITSDIELLEVFYAHTISPVAIAFLFTVVMVAFIGSRHWILGLAALTAYVIVGMVIPLVTSKLGGDDGLKFRMKAGALSGFVLDSLRGLLETIQYGKGNERLQQMMDRTDELSADEWKIKKTGGRNMAVTSTVILCFDLFMMFMAASLYRSGQIEFIDVVLSTVALMSSFGPVVALSALGSTLQHTFASANRVLNVLDESPVVEEVRGKNALDFHGAESKKVSFAYDEQLILDDVSLKIPEGKVIGLVGKSGSGKSTLLKLFMRFWAVERGEVQISGKDVSEINTDNLREMQGYVTQETHLFHDSIKNNLRVAKVDATDEELIEACKKASVHEFILSLPKGYDTAVGELGDTLSGGERQRLGLARAFLHDALFMLLDEPTSNLDSLNEAIILKSLYEEKNEKTVLLVSHRQSTMKIADEIYSVGHGRLS